MQEQKIYKIIEQVWDFGIFRTFFSLIILFIQAFPFNQYSACFLKNIIKLSNFPNIQQPKKKDKLFQKKDLKNKIINFIIIKGSILMSSHLPFPLADFYDALVAKDLKEKLQPYIAQFRKKNIYIIYQCVNRLIQIITNKSQLPIMKFNALLATKYFFDTCQYPGMIFIEVFMLPIIYQIALQIYLKRSQQGIQNYFIDRGAENSKQIRRLGINYVELAAQFIFNAAKVKPYRLIQNRQLKQDSNFSRTVKVLNSKGIQQPEKCIYFIPSYSGATRKRYLKKLKHFSPQPYISFIISQYLEEINLNKKCDLQIKKLLMFGDSFLTSTMVQIIEQELSNMNKNFINKKKYLGLLNDLIRSGEIESIYLINTTDILNQIAEQISKVKGNISHEQGEYIYPKIQASKQQKKQFFIQFLRVIQIWAYCMPTNNQNDQSDITKIYDMLKKKNFIFPKNVILQKISKEMKQNFFLNKQRNDTLMKIIDQDDRTSSRNVGSYEAGKGEFRFHFPDYKQKTQFLQMDQLQDRVFQAKRKIARLTLQKSQLQQNINYLQSFIKDWQEDLQKLDIQEQDPHQLQILVDQGDLCCQQYKLVEPIFELYKKGKISHDTFLKKIQFLQSNDDASFNKSNGKHSRDQSQVLNVSIQHRLKASKHSNVSDKIRKQIQNQYFNQYGHHFRRQDNEDKYSVKTNNRQKSIKRTKNGFQNNNNSVDNYVNRDKNEEKYYNVKENNKLSIHVEKKQNNFNNKQQKQLYQRDISQSQKYKQLNLKRQQNNSNGKHNVAKERPKQNQARSQLKQKQFPNPLKSQKHQHSQPNSQSQISSQSSSENNESQNSHKENNLKTNPYNLRQPRYQQQQNIKNMQSSESGFKIQQKKKITFKQQKSKSRHKQYEQSPQSKRKSVIKHSVISKSSYHSQPTQQKINESNFHQGASIMNYYQIQNIQAQGGMPTVKKSSIKRTQNSGMKNSSHKKINTNNHYYQQHTQKNKSPPLVSQAMSPFKKKSQTPSGLATGKQLKIKQSNNKQYEFIKQNRNESRQQIDQNFAYQNVFKKNSNYQSKSQNDSQISSQSESVIQKRNGKRRIKQSRDNNLQVKDQSQNYNQETSILRKQKNHKFKIKTEQSKTPSKLKMNGTKNRIVLFESSHHPYHQNSNYPQQQRITHINQQYDIKQGKVQKYLSRIEQFGKNADRFSNSKAKNSGIKLVSKNQHKNFDSLYKNLCINSQFSHQSDVKSNGIHNQYQQVTSEYNQMQLARSKSSKNTNNFDYLSSSKPDNKQKSSFIQNHDYGAISMQEIDQQILKYKNLPRHYAKDPQISQIYQPQNLPMLYSYCSQKSIHSKLTDSHTPKANYKSKGKQYSDFKSCYLNMDKEVLPLDLTRSKAVSGSFSLDKPQNFIDFRAKSNSKTTSKVSTVVDAINQKNAKNSILLYKLQRQKNRLVQNLQHKIKSLQINSKMMKTKLAVKDQSIRQGIDRQNSQRDLKLNSHEVKTSRQSSNQNYSVSNYKQSIKNNLHNKVSQTQQNFQKYSTDQHNLSPNKKSKTFSTKSYFDTFFNSFSKNQQTKRTLHKKKGILVKNDEIQIGYMISKKQKHVLLSVFITPSISSIKNVCFQVEHDFNILHKIKPAKYDIIEMKKQQLVAMNFSVQNIPFKLPTLKIKFDGGRNYAINSYNIDLPLTMLLFCQMSQPASTAKQTTTDPSFVQKFKTQVFKCIKRLSTFEKMRQIFPSFKLIKKSAKVNNLLGIIQYQAHKYDIEISLNGMGYLTIEGGFNLGESQKNGTNYQTNIKFLEYLLSTMRLVLEQEQGRKSNKKRESRHND